VREPEIARVSSATSSAAGEISTPVTRHPGLSEAMASAMAPLPVPRIEIIGSKACDLPMELDQRDGPGHRWNRVQGRSNDHQQLGFRPRHQHGRRDGERQRPKFPRARQIGDRRAAQAPFDQAGVSLFAFARWARAARNQSRARQPEHFAEQQFRVEPRRVAVRTERERAPLQIRR
jgi:hypothetical protein